jgi:hypothetical protein
MSIQDQLLFKFSQMAVPGQSANSCKGLTSTPIGDEIEEKKEKKTE